MILQGPQSVTVTPAVVSGQVFCVLSLNLETHTWHIRYGLNGASLKSIAGPMGPNFISTIESFVQTQIELAEGWQAGSSTIVTP